MTVWTSLGKGNTLQKCSYTAHDIKSAIHVINCLSSSFYVSKNSWILYLRPYCNSIWLIIQCLVYEPQQMLLINSSPKSPHLCTVKIFKFVIIYIYWSLPVFTSLLLGPTRITWGLFLYEKCTKIMTKLYLDAILWIYV